MLIANHCLRRGVALRGRKFAFNKMFWENVVVYLQENKNVPMSSGCLSSASSTFEG